MENASNSNVEVEPHFEMFTRAVRGLHYALGNLLEQVEQGNAATVRHAVYSVTQEYKSCVLLARLIHGLGARVAIVESQTPGRWFAVPISNDTTTVTL